MLAGFADTKGAVVRPFSETRYRETSLALLIMTQFHHQRHKQRQPLEQEHALIVACMPLRSNVNLSRIVRTAGCFRISRLVACGRPKMDPSITRDAATEVQIEFHRTLAPVLQKLKLEGYRLVGLEQTTGSVSLFDFAFVRRTVLVVGNERTGLNDEILPLLDDVVEIPVFGLPHSFNVATATSMAMYEYCRQFPHG